MEQLKRLQALRGGLPQPVVRIVGRLVENVVFRNGLNCAESMGATAPSCSQEFAGSVATAGVAETGVPSHFPTMAEVERTMILAAYRRSNRRLLLAAAAARHREDHDVPQAARGETGCLAPVLSGCAGTRNAAFRLGFDQCG